MLEGQLLDRSRVKEIKYWKLQKEELFRRFDSSEKRLMEEEATTRLKKRARAHIGHRTTSNILVSKRAFLSLVLLVLIGFTLILTILGSSHFLDFISSFISKLSWIDYAALFLVGLIFYVSMFAQENCLHAKAWNMNVSAFCL